MKNLSLCFKIFIVCWIILLYAKPFIYAQAPTLQNSIHLTDTLDYTTYSYNKMEVAGYPLSNLFDGNINSWCIISRSDLKDTSTLYLKMSQDINSKMRIYNGNGKNNALCHANGKIKSIKISIHAAIRPEAYVSETGSKYLTAKYSSEQKLELPDSCGFFHFTPRFSPDKLYKFMDKVKTAFHKMHKYPIDETCFILQIDFTDAWTGTRNSDVCISEIAFNDRVWASSARKSQIEKVYVENNHTLLIDKRNDKRVIAFQSDSHIVQLVQISPSNKWAIIILMADKNKGRNEAAYYLINLNEKSIANKLIKTSTGHLPSTNPMYFKIDDNKTIFEFETTGGKQKMLELL